MKLSSELSSAVKSLGMGAKDPAGADFKAVLGLLKANRIPLLTLARGKESNGLRSAPEFREALAGETEVYDLKRSEYRKVREAFLTQGVEAMLLKSVDSHPSFPYNTGNLDLLIRPQFAERARFILGRLGYVELRNIEEPGKFLFKRFTGGKEALALHVHTQIGWGVPFLDNDFVWQGGTSIAEDDPLVSIPSKEVSLLILAAHTIYENKAVTLDDLARFDWLAGKVVNWDAVISQAAGRGWADGLYFSLLLYDYLGQQVFGSRRLPQHIVRRAADFLKGRLGEWHLSRLRRLGHLDLPFRIPFLFSKVLYWSKVVKDSRRGLSRRLCDLVATTLRGLTLKLGIRSQPAMLIAISGADGAGKSLQAELLTRAFQQCGIRASHVWSRCASTAYARFLISSGKALLPLLGARTSRQEQAADKLEVRRQYMENGLLRHLWSFVVLTELTALYNLKVRLSLLLGRTVVCDRYVLDALVEPAVHLGNGDIARGPFLSLLSALNPVPDIAWVIDVPAETALRRRPQDSLQHITAETALYRQLGERLGAKVIDGERAPDEIADEILCETLAKYYGGFHTFLRAAFLSNPSQLNP